MIAALTAITAYFEESSNWLTFHQKYLIFTVKNWRKDHQNETNRIHNAPHLKILFSVFFYHHYYYYCDGPELLVKRYIEFGNDRLLVRGWWREGWEIRSRLTALTNCLFSLLFGDLMVVHCIPSAAQVTELIALVALRTELADTCVFV